MSNEVLIISGNMPDSQMSEDFQRQCFFGEAESFDVSLPRLMHTRAFDVCSGVAPQERARQRANRPSHRISSPRGAR